MWRHTPVVSVLGSWGKRITVLGEAEILSQRRRGLEIHLSSREVASIHKGPGFHLLTSSNIKIDINPLGSDRMAAWFWKTHCPWLYVASWSELNKCVCFLNQYVVWVMRKVLKPLLYYFSSSLPNNHHSLETCKSDMFLSGSSHSPFYSWILVHTTVHFIPRAWGKSKCSPKFFCSFKFWT